MRVGAAPRAAALWVALLAVAPLFWLIVRSCEGGASSWWTLLGSPRTASLVATTIGITGGALAVALFLAIPLAWLVACTDLPGRRAFAVAAALPLVIPSYVGAFGLVAFAGPRGVLQGLLEPFGVERLPAFVYGPFGAILVLGLFSYPYIYLPLVASLRELDPALVESARLLGAGPWRRLRTVVLPQLARPLAAGSLLVSLYALSDFGAVSITRVATLTVSIDNTWRSLLDRGEAARMGLLLVAIAALLVTLEALLVRGLPRAGARPVRHAPQHRLGRLRPWALVFTLTTLFLALVAPLGTTASWAFYGLYTGRSLDFALAAARNSALLALAAAFLTVVAAWPLAWWSARDGGKLSRLLERCAWLGHALPGLVLALGMVFLAIRFAAPLYQTAPLLILAYLLRFLPEALGPMRASLARVPPALEEAGRSLGRSPFQVLRSVVLPIAAPGVLAGAGMVALTTLKELPATLVLRPIGLETLATRVWRASAEGFFIEAALPALLLVVLATPITFWLALRPLLQPVNEVESPQPFLPEGTPK